MGVRQIAVFVAEGFNLAATTAFIDPLRAANYLSGEKLYSWTFLHAGKTPPVASIGVALQSNAFQPSEPPPDIGIVSTSWTPEQAYEDIVPVIRNWYRHGTTLVGIDTGAFVLAAAGLLEQRRATVHYEHIDSFAETYPGVHVSEDLYVIDDQLLSACGGGASTDLALQVVRRDAGDTIANSVARYLFHQHMRPEGARQLSVKREPLGSTAPALVHAAIRIMEAHLEEVVPIPQIAAKVGVSQSTLERKFRRCLDKAPARYYADIRLDRARGLAVQTDLTIVEVAIACGFGSAEHFSRAYAKRFGLPPQVDRQRGRVPFEFRAWPMHERGGKL